MKNRNNNELVKEFVIKQLSQAPDIYDVTEKGDNFWMFCPFHDQKNLHLATKHTLIVNTGNPEIPYGHFWCFSCSSKDDKESYGSWNKLAKRLKLKPLKTSQLYQDRVLEVKEELLEDLGLKEKDWSLDNIYNQSIEWKARKDWRGISGKLIKLVGGRLTVSKTEDIQLFLPVRMHKEDIGGTYCRLEKEEGLLSYVNLPGKWALNALFPFDFVIDNMYKKSKIKILVLVEGQRDALNLIQHGIPALSLLGSATKWSDYIGDMIVELNPDILMLGFDLDDTGERANAKATDYFKNKITYKKLPLKQILHRPKRKKKGKDPGDLTTKEIEFIKHWMYKKYKWKQSFFLEEVKL